MEIVHQGLADPQRPSLEEDTDAKVISRYICSTNTIHQADQILRRCVSLRMIEAKGKQYALLFRLSLLFSFSTFSLVFWFSFSCA